jgi:YVTN family beta-propeller protein
MMIHLSALALLFPALLFPFVTNATPLMYVPSGGANDLVIIDLKTDKVVGRIPELENAHGLSSSPKSEYLVAGSMQPVEPGKSRSAAKPTEMSEAEHASHHTGGNSAEKYSNSPSFISIVHPKHGHVMRRISVRGLTHHTAVSPDGKYAIAVHSGAGGISVINLDRMEVMETLQTGLWPNYAVFASDGKRLYVSNTNPGTVSEIDTKNWQVVREHKVGKEPEHIVLSQDNKILFTSNKGDGTVSALDLGDGIVRNRYPVGKKAHGLDMSDDGRWLFSASKGGNTLTRIDLSNDKSMTIDLKPAPYHLAYIPGMNKLYVSSRKLPKIWVIDSTTLEIISEIDLGKGVAHQMVLLNN